MGERGCEARVRRAGGEDHAVSQVQRSELRGGEGIDHAFNANAALEEATAICATWLEIIKNAPRLGADRLENSTVCAMRQIHALERVKSNGRDPQAAPRPRVPALVATRL